MTPQPPTITVLVCDDDAMIREALREVLDAQAGLSVIALARDGAEAAALAARHCPAVALLDVRMPGGGAQAVREIRDRSPRTRILAFSAHDDADTIARMRAAGVGGYLVKGAPNQVLVEAIRRLAAS